MSKEMVYNNLKSNAHGAPELKKRNGSSLRKNRGAPVWIACGTTLITESGINDNGGKDFRILKYPLSKLRVASSEIVRGEIYCLLHEKPEYNNDELYLWKELQQATNG